jgi:hypothetical protein
MSAEEIARAVDAAAVEWCGEKERETFPEDIAYFKHNWRSLPGFKERVDRHRAILQGENNDQQT